MKNKLLRTVLMLTMGFCLTAAAAWAQTGTIKGTIINQETGEPLVAANVYIPDLQRGAASNATGSFSIENVPYGTYELRVSYIGYTEETIPVTVDEGTEALKISLSRKTGRLDELVVTALGQTQQINRLSYSAESVDAEAIAESGTADIFSSLSGKVAGLSISGQNGMGASSDIVLRGINSLTGNNQVLFVIDGVPMPNARFNSAAQQAGFAGYNFGSTALDINPSNIESMTVLKGAAATALYGSRASNGAIIISTKQGAPVGEDISVVYNGTVSVNRINEETFPTYQKLYGAGYDKDELKMIANPWPDVVQGDSLQTIWYPADASWGPRFDSEKMVYDWQSFYPGSSHYQEPVPYVASSNFPVKFFETGTNIQNSLFLRGGINDRSGYYALGYSQSNVHGTVPNSELNKYKLSFSGAYDFSEVINVQASVDYTRTDALGRSARGYNTIMSSFRQWWQVGTDILAQKRTFFSNRNNTTWNLTAPRDGAYFWNNPYFVRYQNYETDTRDRYVGFVKTQYDVADWLNLTGRMSYTGYHQIIEERLAVGSVSVGKYNAGSGYQRRSIDYSEYNFRIQANYQQDLSEKVSINGLIGFNARRTHRLSIAAITSGGLITPGIYSLDNSINQIQFPNETDRQLGVNGLFASLNVDYDNFLLLRLTARRDKASSLPKKNNTYFYPSVSGSFLFSELIESDWLSIGKIRASWARVGATAPPLSLRDTFVRLSNFSGRAIYTLPGTKNNPNLKPEITEAYEAGLQLGFFNNRMYFDASYYHESTFNQIITVPISRATGYDFKFVNAGEVQNQGVELSLRGRPIVTNDFSWQLTVNWTKNYSKLIKLAKGVKYFEFVAPQGGVSIGAYEGEPLGVIRGSDYTYTAAGRRIVRDDGTYVLSDPNNIIGNQLPEWQSGISNRLSYKNWSFNVLVDIRYGGQIFSLDQWYGQGTGLYPSTVGLNNKGNPIRSAVAEGGGVLLPGVVGVDENEDGVIDKDSNGNPIYNENTTYISAYLAHGYHGATPQSAYVYDATYVKLREVGLTYNLPVSLLENMGGIDQASISLVGRNLWILYKDLPFADPEASLSAGNVSGYSGGNFPAIRSLSLNIELNF